MCFHRKSKQDQQNLMITQKTILPAWSKCTAINKPHKRTVSLDTPSRNIVFLRGPPEELTENVASLLIKKRIYKRFI